MKRFLIHLVLLAVPAALAACGSEDAGVAVHGAWARTSAAGQTTGAVYFQLTAEEDDRLLGASVPASVAADAQVHEVVMAEVSDEAGTEHDMASTDDADDAMDEMSGDGHDAGMEGMGPTDDADSIGATDGQMRMQELTDGLVLTAGETVRFEPGGYHVMLLDLADPLEVGDEIELTLDFEQADDLTLTVEVAESAP